MDTFTIGQLAISAEVSVETIRFYEKKGLIYQPIKPKVGYRKYPQSTLSTLKFIHNAKKLGFSLAEISEFIGINTDGNNLCCDARSISEKKLQSIEQKIKLLEQLKENLTSLIEVCKDEGTQSHCPIIDSFKGKIL